MHFVGYSQEILDMVPHFVSHDIRAGEVARRTEVLVQLIEDDEIDRDGFQTHPGAN